MPFFIELFAFALALWLGLYLVAREGGDARLKRAGWGLAAYAFALALGMLRVVRITPLITIGYRFFLFVPALFWVGVLLVLLPENSLLRPRLDTLWRYGLLPALVGLYAFLNTGQNPIWLVALAILPLLLAFGLNVWRWTTRPRPPLPTLLLASLFFSLGTGLLLIPLAQLIHPWLVLAIGLDLLVLGLVIGRWDALEQGEAFWPDFIRSFTTAFLTVCIFGGQVGLVMYLTTGKSFPMLVLLLTTTAAAISFVTLNQPVQNLVEHVSLAAFPRIRQERAQLQGVAAAITRTSEPEQFDWTQYDAAAFTRLTRRTLSHLGNLPRLASSPLTQLPVVTRRLNGTGDTLERTKVLQAVLIEQIIHLKPPGDELFGTSEVWRHYNALYFPYVVGLKPYSRHTDYANLDEASQQALAWLQSQVPERTLYNWQNAAAQLIAAALRSG